MNKEDTLIFIEYVTIEKNQQRKQNKRKKTTCLCLSENGTGNRVGCKNDNKKSALSFLV